jgi:hypothetical protein
MKYKTSFKTQEPPKKSKQKALTAREWVSAFLTFLG